MEAPTTMKCSGTEGIMRPPFTSSASLSEGIEKVKELIEARRRLYPPWWLRLWRTITHKRVCLT